MTTHDSDGRAGAAKISARNVTKAYPTLDGFIVALEDFSLEVAEGDDFLRVQGPTIDSDFIDVSIIETVLRPRILAYEEMMS